MKKVAIVVLGAPNDAEGNLSTIAIERCQRALAEYAGNPGARILPTGGWGDHFNTTDKPHGHYIQQYLMAHGVPKADFLECAESANTIQDAQLVRPIVRRHEIDELVVVTSDFHIPRAQFLFEREFPDLRLSFSAARTHLPEDELARRREHEERWMIKLREKATRPGKGIAG